MPHNVCVIDIYKSKYLKKTILKYDIANTIIISLYDII